MPISTINQNGLTNPLTSVAANTVTSAAATALTLQSAGTTAVTITTAQNVGIGTSSPNAKLDVFVSSGVNLALTKTNGAYLGFYEGTTARAAINGLSGADGLAFATGSAFTERMRIDSGGQVGINTTTPADRLTVNGNIALNGGVNYVFANGGGSGGSLNAGIGLDGTNNRVLFYTGGAGNERMRIDSSGNVLVNTTSSTGHKMTVQSAAGAGGIDCVGGATNGYYAMRVDMPSTNTYGVLFRNNGNNVGDIRINSSSTTYNTSSDYRLKENIAPMTGALDKVSALKPVTYKWKSTGEESQGFIAHELQAVVPDCVTGEKDAVDAEGNPVYQGIDTSFLVATLTAAIQELKAEFDAYKASHP